MKTRSQTSRKLYEVNIDFDEASNAWRANKKYIGNGTYEYIRDNNNDNNNSNKTTRCIQQTQCGRQCKRESISNSEYCFQHKK